MGKSIYRRLTGSLVSVYAVLMVVFVLAPTVVVIGISFNHGQYLVFPPERLSLRWYTEAVVRPEWRQAFFNSLWVAVLTACASTVVGLLGALAVYRGRFRGRGFLSRFFLSPLLVPQLLLGIAMLFFLAQLNMNGTRLALFLGHILITVPYTMRLILAALPGVPDSVEEVAMTLGADELRTTLKVTLPMIKSAILSGWLFAFILSFDNVMVSLFLSSARAPTLPVKILHTIQETSDPTIAAISTIFVAVSLTLMVIIERTVGLQFDTF